MGKCFDQSSMSQWPHSSEQGNPVWNWDIWSVSPSEAIVWDWDEVLGPLLQDLLAPSPVGESFNLSS